MSVDEDHTARFTAGLLRRLASFGISADRVQVIYDDITQDYDILIESGELTEAQIKSVRAATAVGGYVRFANDQNARRFAALIYSEGRELMKTMAVEMSKTFAGLPSFDPAKTTLADFARELEAYCGITPGTALTVDGDAVLLVGQPGQPLDLPGAIKLNNAVIATLGGRDDVRIGVVGGF